MASADRQGRRDRRPILERPALLSWVLALDAAALAVLFLAFHLGAVGTAVAHLGILSACCFLAFAMDKWRAGSGSRRVSEVNLLALSALGGAPGGLLAMGALRHKTRRPLFTVLLPTFVFVHVVILALLAS